MLENERVAGDLEFVRGVVEGSERRPVETPFSVGVLWGVIVLVGCVMVDFEPRHCWIYWMTAGPVGSMLTGVIMSRKVAASGELRHEIGVLHSLHWSCLFWAGVPVVLLAMNGRIDGWTMGQLLLLLSGVVYYLAGVHLERRFTAPGIAMVIGAAALVYQHRFVWSGVGLLVFLTLLVSFGMKRKGEM